MKLLVTGSSGFVGTVFLRQYAGIHEIVPFSLPRQGWEGMPDLRGVDAVVHLAALVHQMQGAPAEAYRQANIEYPLELASRAREAGVRHFLFLSTVKVYGEVSRTPFTEDSPCMPEDDYGHSKLEAEQRLSELAGSEFAVSLLRTPLIYGEGVKGNILKLMQWIERSPVLPLGCIRNRRSMVYVGNLVTLMERILQQGKTGVCLASDPQAVSTTELVVQIVKAFGKKGHPLCIPGMGTLLKHWKPSLYDRLYADLEVDSRKTVRELGFVAPFTFADGVGKMVEWYRNRA